MLTDAKVKVLKPKPKPYKLSDQGGLYLYITVNGSKSWRYDYRIHGTRRSIAFGLYPFVSLAEAREKHLEAKRLLAKGIDPWVVKKADKETHDDTFKAIAESWYEALAPHRSSSWRGHTRCWLDRDLHPVIGNKPVRSITPADVLAIMRRLEAAGTAHTANFVRQTASRVFQYAIRNLRADYDPAQSLRGAVVIPRSKHRAALAAKDIPAFLEAIDAYPGKLATKIAVNLLLLTMVRKSELIKATWEEVNFEAREWRIFAGRTKMKAPHIVPLSTQALDCFRELQTLCCGSRYVLPHHGDLGRPMGLSTLNKMFARMGYGHVTVHGLRATASTLLNEQGFKPDVIERQLAHAERNRIRAAYNRAEYLEDRRHMMQHWANYLDAVVSGAAVTALKSQAA